MNQAHLDFLASPEWARLLETTLIPWIDSVGDLGDDVLEIGPGPGLTTDILSARVARLTAIEADEQLAASLSARLASAGVVVINGDATGTQLETGRFSAVTCFSVLHHIPSREEQDRLFSEAARILRPGGMFVGTDSRDIGVIRAGHADDIFVPVDPETLGVRFAAAGFVQSEVAADGYQVKFVARKA
ncbi:MAG TPA: class I SAM-dependent methyltransferase [Actinomycetota bacterium]|nr:class I SAM-dependent methyltransferase [Actinomycetota bacterium]